MPLHRGHHRGSGRPFPRDEPVAGVAQHDAVSLFADAGVDAERRGRIRDEATIRRTAGTIQKRNVRVIGAGTADEALQALFSLVPAGVGVTIDSPAIPIEIGPEELLRRNPKL